MCHPPLRHLGVGYRSNPTISRSPNNTDLRRNESDDTEFSTVALMGSPSAFSPQNPTISSGEVDNIELTTTTGLFPAPTELEANSSDTTLTTNSESEPVSTTVSQQISSTTPLSSVATTTKKITTSKAAFAGLFSSTPMLAPTESSTTFSSTTKKKVTNTTRSKMLTKFSSRTTVASITTATTSPHPSPKTSRMREKPATLLFYTNKTSVVRLTTTTAKPQNPPPIFASEVSILENKIAQLSLGADKSADLSAEVDQIVPPINENDINSIAKDKYTNLRDWRLDDRTINDTDIIPERQVACSNATIIASQRKCSWSGIEHLLVVWSFASLLVWIVMIGVCFYRQANKPAWVEFRERELQRMAQSRVLQHEHPWIHADAFEETRCKNKNELTMIQGTF